MNNDFNTAPSTPVAGADPRTEVMSTKDWLIMWLVFLIPCVNIVMVFVWAFSDGTNFNKRNYCRAYLIIMLIMFAIVALFWLLVGAAFMAFL